MSRHSFDPDIAKRVGVNAAVIFSNICWWCERNAVKGRNIHEGNAWTFNSIKVMEDLFGYLSERQIRHAVQKLEDAGLIEAGNFNRDNRDRTKWYSIAKDTEAFYKFVSPHLTNLSTPTFDKNVEPLPDVKQDSKNTPISPKGTNDLFSENEEQENLGDPFEDFWKVFPHCPSRRNKKGAQTKFWQIVHGKMKGLEVYPSAENLVSAAKAFAATNPDREWVPAAEVWLNKSRWIWFLGGGAVEYREEDLNPNAKRMLQSGIVPPSKKNPDGTPNAEAQYWLREYGYWRAAE